MEKKKNKKKTPLKPSQRNTNSRTNNSIKVEKKILSEGIMPGKTINNTKRMVCIMV